MKIRTGFVSNSSSSSFLIYGVSFEKSELLKILSAKLNKPADEIDIHEDFEKLTGYYVYHPCDGDYYMGRSWSSIQNDETGKQFKDSIEKDFKEIFGDGVKVQTLEEAWMG